MLKNEYKEISINNILVFTQIKLNIYSVNKHYICQTIIYQLYNAENYVNDFQVLNSFNAKYKRFRSP